MHDALAGFPFGRMTAGGFLVAQNEENFSAQLGLVERERLLATAVKEEITLHLHDRLLE